MITIVSLAILLWLTVVLQNLLYYKNLKYFNIYLILIPQDFIVST